MADPAGIDKRAVMVGELLIASIHRGVVQIGLGDAGDKIVDDETARSTANEVKGGDVTLERGELVEVMDDAHEHVAAVG